MTNNTIKGVKKSNFTSTTSVPDTATLDYVSNGQNLKIAYSDFIRGLGVSGSIQQTGNPFGSPVLDPQGAIHAIRNIVGARGINAQIDSQNSIELSTDFSFDQTGVTIVDDPLADAPAFRSIVAGQDINVLGSSGQVTISANTDGLKPNNREIINQATDFPPAVGGVIPLVAGTEYYIGDAVTISAPLDFSNANIVLRGQTAVSFITYTGTGNMLRGTDAGRVFIQGLTVDQPNATTGDAIFDFRDTVTPSSIVNIDNVTILNCDKIANFSNILGATYGFSAVFACQDGISVLNTGTSILNISELAILGTSATFVGVDLGTNVFSGFEIQNLQIRGEPGGIGISGLANSGNILSGQRGTVFGCEFLGGMTPLQNITSGDIRYVFNANSGIADTFPDLLLSLNNNATETVISAANTPTKVLGTWVVESGSQFTGDASGRGTYNGEVEIRVPITISVAVEPASGTNKTISLYVAKNGSVINNSAITAIADSGDTKTITLVWQDGMVENDYIELWAENNSDSINLLITDSVMRLR